MSAGYFETMGIELIKGRVFEPPDKPDTPLVMVIDEALAQQHFSNEDPSKRIAQSTSGTPSYEIVGVVRHVEQYSLEGQAQRTPQFYLNFNQIPPERLPSFTRRINVLTRTDVDPAKSYFRQVRGQISALNKDQAVFNVRTMEEIVSQNLAQRRFSMLLLTVFAIVALLLASQVSGMMSYAVAQRTRNRIAHDARGAKRKCTQTGDRSGDETRIVWCRFRTGCFNRPYSNDEEPAFG